MTERTMPSPVNLGRPFDGCMGEVIHHRDDNMTDNTENLPVVMGYFIPKWQRPLVWTNEQNVKLIESVWLGLPIGTYTFNRKYGSRYDNLLVDGQQRMNAIHIYLNDGFKVFGKLWSETTILDQRWFRSSGRFGSYITETDDETYLREYYNMMNFSGTSHSEDQRA